MEIDKRKGVHTEYRIEYEGAKCYNFAHSREVKQIKDETITDIRKGYKMV